MLADAPAMPEATQNPEVHNPEATAARAAIDAAFASIVGSTFEAVGVAPIEPSGEERVSGAGILDIASKDEPPATVRRKPGNPGPNSEYSKESPEYLDAIKVLFELMASTGPVIVNERTAAANTEFALAA